MVLSAQSGQGRAEGVRGQRGVRRVEGFDFLGDREVLLGDGAVGNLGVAKGHVHAVVAEHRGDGFQTHAPVGGLGGQGVAHLVGVDVADPGGRRGQVEQPGDGVAVQRGAVHPRPQQRVGRVDVRGAVLTDDGDQVGVQGQVAVVVELADGDVEPVPVTDEHDRVGAQRGELPDAQSGAQQDLADDPDQQPALGLGGAQELRSVGVVEAFA